MFKNLPYKEYVYFSLVLNIVSIILILILKGILPPVVPLFYGLPAGAMQLSPTVALILIPTAGVVITLINIFISRLTKDAFLKKTLIISSAFISFLLSIAVFKIIFLVGFF